MRIFHFSISNTSNIEHLWNLIHCAGQIDAYLRDQMFEIDFISDLYNTFANVVKPCYKQLIVCLHIFQ